MAGGDDLGYVPIEFDRIEVGVLSNCREQLTDIDALAEDIAEKGLLTPLLVLQKRLKSKPHVLPFEVEVKGRMTREVWDRYILVSGHRRHAAILKLREKDPDAFRRVRVTLYQGNEDDALFAQASENLQRVDLTPAEESAMVAAFLKRGHAREVIAKRLGKSVAWVGVRARFAESAAEPIKRAVTKGSIAFDAACDIASMDTEAEQVAALESYVATAKAEGGGVARRNTQRAAGKRTRPTMAEVRAKLEESRAALDRARSDSTKRALTATVRALEWVTGDGETTDDGGE